MTRVVIVPKILVVALAVALTGFIVVPSAQAAPVAVPYALGAGDPVLTAALGEDSAPCVEGSTSGSFSYKLVHFTVSDTGSYVVADASTPNDGRVGIYTGDFSPASQTDNCLAFVDVDETVSLNQGFTYGLVLSTGTDGGAGDYSVTFDGPGSPTVLTPTTTTLVTNPNPSELSQTATLTATVVGGSPTGSVEFSDGASVLGSSPLSGGVATLAVSSLALGDHSLTATYGGDVGHEGSVGGVVHTVVPVPPVLTPTTTTLVTNPNPSELSQTATLTATVVGGSPTGSVEFSDGASVLGSSPLSGGVATLAVSSLALGDHSLTATYGGDVGHEGSVGGVVHTVVPVPPVLTPTTTTLVTNPNPSELSQTATLTATVVGGSPTGSVEFSDGASVLGSSPLSGGVATLAVSSLALGDHSLTATYGGDVGHEGSVGGVVHTVVPVPPVLTPTTTTLVTNPNPSELSQTATLTATVVGGSPTGSVEFSDGASVLGSSPLSGGVATLAVSSLALGDHSLTATYGGDVGHEGSVGGVVHTVVPVPPVLTPTTTTLVTNPNPSELSQTATLTATVVGGSPTGSVEFSDGASVLGSSPLSGGVATLAVSSLALGDHSLTATYGGDVGHEGSVGGVVHTVVPVPPVLTPTTTTLVTNPNPSELSQTATLTATVVGGSPTGSVEFSDGASVLGSSPLSGGVATLAVSSLALGDHSLTATYGGDVGHEGSVGGVVHTVVPVPPVLTPTTTTLVTNPNPSELSQTATLTATVVGGSPTGSVEFSDGASVLGSSPLSGGVATLAVSSLALGDHSLTATYGGDVGHEGSVGGVVHTVVPVPPVLTPTTTTLVTNPNPSELSQTATLTATVVGGSPTGSVEFSDGASVLGSSPLSGGVATLAVSSLALGDHSLTATYGGDVGHEGSVGGVVHTVVPVPPVPPVTPPPLTPTTTRLAANPTPSELSQTTTLTAKVTGGSPTGSVKFRDGASVLGTSPLSGGVATLAVSSLKLGDHALTATYGGDSKHSGSVGSVGHKVVPGAKPKVTLTISEQAPYVGQKVKLTWDVTGADKVKALGSWTGKLGKKGSRTVKLTELGFHVFKLKATNVNGSKQATVKAVAVRAPKDLTLVLESKIIGTGSRVEVKAAGLDAKERFKVFLDGEPVGKGFAGEKGAILRVQIPKDVKEGDHVLSVTGSNEDRVGSIDIVVVGPKTLDVKVAKASLKPSKSQTVTVSGLAPGEALTLTYDGELLVKAKANKNGEFKFTFPVGSQDGTKTVEVVGATRLRKGRAAFEVRGEPEGSF